MAIAHAPRTGSFPIGRPLALPRPETRGLVRKLCRAIAWTWIVLNVVQWAPTPDANGNCGCPLCNPFGTSPRISAAGLPPIASAVQP